jgi:hypothetical protein
LKEFVTGRRVAAVFVGLVLLVVAGCAGGSMSSKSAGPGPSPTSSPTPTPTPSPSAHSVGLTWSPSSSSGVIGYNVYRSTTPSPSGSYVRIGNVAGTSFTDSSVQGGQTYFYTVTTVNSANLESAQSSPISATVPSP